MSSGKTLDNDTQQVRDSLIIRKYSQGKGPTRIASYLGIPRSTVQSRLIVLTGLGKIVRLGKAKE